MSPRGRFAPDRGLTIRMVVVVFLLGLVYVIGIAALIAYGVSLIGIIVVAGGFALLQYFASDKIAMFSMGAEEVSPQQAPQLHAVVDRLCALSDSPKPRVGIAHTDVPNAFATGRNPTKSVVVVTTGLLRRLGPEELEGVLAHELSHVAHRDVAVMTVASFLGVLAGIATRFALQASFFSGGYGGRRRGSNDRDNSVPVIFVVIAVSALVYAVSFLLIRALSRYRELAADRSGAILTGRPSALASALTKISGEIARIPTRDLRAQEPFNAFFVMPLAAQGFSLSSLFSTHPPLERRLEQLAELSRELA